MPITKTDSSNICTREGTQIWNEREPDEIRIGSLSFPREAEVHFFTKLHRDKRGVCFMIINLIQSYYTNTPALMME